jgi:hypothetical protein
MNQLSAQMHAGAMDPQNAASPDLAANSPGPVGFATFWQGPVTPLTYTCLASFSHHGVGLRVYSYDGSIEVPPGIEVADARLIISDETCRTRYLVDGQPSLARFTNLFRYEMIRQTSFCWVDADILCFKSPDFSEEPLIFGRQDNWGKHAFNTAVLKFPTDHPILQSLIEEATQAIDVDSTWGTLGPELVTRLIREHNIQRLSRKRSEFYSIAPHKFWKMLLPLQCQEVCETTRDSTFLHLWQQMFKWFHYDGTLAPPVGSFLHGQCDKLGTLRLFSGIYGETKLREILGDAIAK